MCLIGNAMRRFRPPATGDRAPRMIGSTSTSAGYLRKQNAIGLKNKHFLQTTADEPPSRNGPFSAAKPSVIKKPSKQEGSTNPYGPMRHANGCVAASGLLLCARGFIYGGENIARRKRCDRGEKGDDHVSSRGLGSDAAGLASVQ
jgi:hypothetical protein